MLHKCWFDTLILELLLLKQLHLCLMGCSAIELAIITWVLSIFQQILNFRTRDSCSRATFKHFPNQSAAKMNLDGSVLEIDVCRQETSKRKDNKNSPNFSRIPLTFRITECRGNGLDEGKDRTGGGGCAVAVSHSSAWLRFQSLQSEMRLVLHGRPCSQQRRHHSNYSGEGDKRCQHSISSCKQIMLRGPDDVCTRNKIIWVQF